MNEFLILFILKIKASNIYEIKKYIDSHLAPYMQVSSGAIIPALKRLEKEECIRSEKQISQGGLKKSFYFITEKGEEFFNKLLLIPILGSPQSIRREIEPLLMLVDHTVLTEEQNETLKLKLTNAIEELIIILKKTIAKDIMNKKHMEAELEFLTKIADTLTKTEFA